MSTNSSATLQPNIGVVEVICNGTSSDCSGKGICIGNVCKCVHYYVGTYCETHFLDVLGDSYYAFSLTFFVLLSVLSVITAFQTYRSFKFWKTNKLVHKLKAINHIIVIIFLVLRILYFALDPFGKRNVISPLAEQVMYNFPIYFLFTSYEILLLYWAHTYHTIAVKLSPNASKRAIDKCKPVFIIANSIWLLFEILRVILGSIDSLKKKLSAFSTAYNIFVGMSILLCLIGFSTYGSLLVKKIKLIPEERKKKKSTVRRLIFITVAVSASLITSIMPPSIFFFLGISKTPGGNLILLAVVHSIELFLVIELLYVMKPKRSSILSTKNTSESDKTSGKNKKNTNSFNTPSRTLDSMDTLESDYQENETTLENEQTLGSSGNYFPFVKDNSKNILLNNNNNINDGASSDGGSGISSSNNVNSSDNANINSNNNDNQVVAVETQINNEVIEIVDDDNEMDGINLGNLGDSCIRNKENNIDDAN